MERHPTQEQSVSMPHMFHNNSQAAYLEDEDYSIAEIKSAFPIPVPCLHLPNRVALVV